MWQFRNSHRLIRARSPPWRVYAFQMTILDWDVIDSCCVLTDIMGGGLEKSI